MASIWNNRISVSIFGEAQGPAIGVTIDNLPPGEFIEANKLHEFMERRCPGVHSSDNFIQIMSGILKERTTGTPLCAFIQNTQTEAAPDLSRLNQLPRPGHADYTGTLRYRGFNDIREGGHFSDRLTAPLCFAGAICGQILERRGIYTGAHALEIHGIRDKEFDYINVDKEAIMEVRRRSFPVIDFDAGTDMLDDIRRAADGNESIGGIVECASVNVPAGIGSPIFDGLENSIAQLMFGIPGVRGIEFGAGIQSAKMVGSQHNDEFYVNDHGHIRTMTNHHGGILGGISSGMPIIVRVAFKPTPTLRSVQDSLTAVKSEKLDAEIGAESCIVPRMVPCVEACVNLALLAHMMDYPHFN